MKSKIGLPKLFVCALTLAIGCSDIVQAGETKSLPKGASLFYFRQSNVAVDGQFTPSGTVDQYKSQGRISAQTIGRFAPAASELYKELRNIDPTLAEKVDFGSIDIQVKPEVTHRVFGYGYGITDNLMIVGYMPFIEAKVKVAGQFTDTGSVQSAVNALKSDKYSGNSSAEVWAQILSQFPQMSGGFLQSVMINELGYKPLGSWQASGIGDIVLFAQYRYFEMPDYKQAVRFGTSMPTGHRDDPDNLVDIPFGSGYWAPYVESVHDFIQMNGRLHLSAMGKIIQPLPDKKTFRLYEDSSMPVTPKKANLNYQPGTTLALTGTAEFFFNKKWSLSSAFVHSFKMEDQIHGGGSDVSVLERESKSTSDVATLGLNFSTVELFKQKAFALPMSMGLFYTRVIAGENFPHYDAGIFDFTLYF